jgi:hypothetical protein
MMFMCIPGAIFGSKWSSLRESPRTNACTETTDNSASLSVTTQAIRRLYGGQHRGNPASKGVATVNREPFVGLEVFNTRFIDEIGMRQTLANALESLDRDTHLHVSFDVDFLDPEIAPGWPSDWGRREGGRSRTVLGSPPHTRCRGGLARGMAQSGSASGLGPEGRRFESCCPDQFQNFSAASRHRYCHSGRTCDIK